MKCKVLTDVWCFVFVQAYQRLQIQQRILQTQHNVSGPIRQQEQQVCSSLPFRKLVHVLQLGATGYRTACLRKHTLYEIRKSPLAMPHGPHGSYCENYGCNYSVFEL